jgi:two-component system chemotaxis sensor kinase CheA
MNFDHVIQTFIVESREVLEDMERGLLEIETTADLPETINAIFRAAHTVKGAAGLFNLDHIVAFTHVVESVLDAVRRGEVKLTGDLIPLLLACCDYIKLLVEEVAAGRMTEDATITAQGAPLLERLRPYTQATAPGSSAPSVGVWEAPAGPDQPAAAGAGSSDAWHISLRFGPNVLRNGMDPLSFLRYLGKLGTIRGLVTLYDPAGLVEDMDPESCFLGFEIALHSGADKATLEGAFDFVRDDCRVTILPPHSQVSEYVRLIRELPEESTRLGAILLQCGSVTARELEAALAAQAAAPAGPRIGAILVEQGAVSSAVVDAALLRQAQTKETRTQDARSIRVDAEKLDRLINLVGELIIAAAGAELEGRRTRDAELQERTSSVSSLVQEVRDSALQLRMVKIAATFNRFQRVVYDVSREIGKDIALEVSGEETELDKTVVEKISDPLMHLVRNAIDHGIEPADVRAARGKPTQGTVRLNAFHDSGSIVIEVRDDGGGLKRDKILAKAIERGLIESGRSLSDEEIFALIFEPGFSTAEQVTNLSGRGVGMDVVKRNITSLRGSVEIASREGAGTTITVRLPLTLAIINGFLVGVGNSVFVVPLDMIEECVEFSAVPGHDYTNLRGRALPFIRLGALFRVEGQATTRQNIVVVNHAGKKAGLVVDTLLGEFQTVIKPLAAMFNHVRCVSGSTILGDGRVALILDVPALIQQASQPDLARSQERRSQPASRLLEASRQPSH